jgi:hypothetical protein
MCFRGAAPALGPLLATGTLAEGAARPAPVVSLAALATFSAGVLAPANARQPCPPRNIAGGGRCQFRHHRSLCDASVAVPSWGLISAAAACVRTLLPPQQAQQ